jgi:hypothetical protein
MRVSYDKDTRKRAVEDNKRMFTLAITGKKGKGGVTIQGLCDDDNAQDVMNLITESFAWKADIEQQ